MRKIENKVYLEGKVYEHKLESKVVQNTNSKNYGTPFISGTLDVATDNECLNIVTVHFTYVTEKTSTGKDNTTFSALKKIMESGKTVIEHGPDEATVVKIDTAVALNDFYTEKDGKEVLVSAKRAEGGFVHILNKIEHEEEESRNKFSVDAVLRGYKIVEKNEEKHIDEDYMILNGFIFNFRNAILPVDFVVRKSDGMKYFEHLDPSSQNLIFTKLFGYINSSVIKEPRVEESAFGAPIITEYTRNIKEWVIISAAAVPYEFGDENTGITVEELQKALSDRELYLADVKKRSDDWKAAKAANNTKTVAATNVASMNALAGGFNF